MVDKVIKQHAQRLLKRYAKDRALQLEWCDGFARVLIIGYDSWLYRDDLMQLLGANAVFDLDVIATEVFADGEHVGNPKRKR